MLIKYQFASSVIENERHRDRMKDRKSQDSSRKSCIYITSHFFMPRVGRSGET